MLYDAVIGSCWSNVLILLSSFCSVKCREVFLKGNRLNNLAISASMHEKKKIFFLLRNGTSKNCVKIERRFGEEEFLILFLLLFLLVLSVHIYLLLYQKDM